MHTSIELGLNKLGSTAYDGFLPEELDLFIDKIVNRKINSLLSVERDDLRLGFQGDQKRLDDIRTLISTDYGSYADTPLKPNDPYMSVPLPKDYRNLVNVRVMLNDLTCNKFDAECLKFNGRPPTSTDYETLLEYTTAIKKCFYTIVPARPIRQNKVYEVLRNPFSKTTPQSPVITISGKNFQVFQNKNFIVSGVIVDYIRKPLNVSLISGVDCELAGHIHDEIVDEVVNHLLEVTGNPRFQSSTIDIARSE